MDLRDTITKLFSARLLLSVIEFGAVAYFTQVLGAGAIGSFFLYQTVIGLAGIGSNLGLARAAEKELSSGGKLGEVITTTALLKILLLIPFLIGIFLTQSFIDTYIEIEGVSLLVAIGLIIGQTKRLVIRLLAGQMQVDRTASLRLAGKLTWVVVSVALIYSGMDVMAVLIGFIIGDVVIVLAALPYLELALGRPTIERARTLLSFGYYIVLRSAGGYIYSWMDVAILGFFVPNTSIGAYEIAWRVGAVFLQLTNAIRESIFPKISQVNANGNIPEIRTILFRWLQPPVYLTIPGFFGAIVLGEMVLGIPFGDEVAIAAPVLVIFMAEKVVRSGHLLFSATLYGMDRPELGYRAEVVGLGLNFVLNLTLIPAFGIIGAAIATATSSVLATFINGYYLEQLIGLQLPLRRFGWSLVSSSIMGVTVYFVEPYLPLGWVGLSIGVTFGALFYAFLLLMNNSIRDDISSFRTSVS